jgi:hypothetical protein
MKKILVALAALVLPAFAATPQPYNTAVLSWTAPTQNVDGTSIQGPITYKVYQGPRGGNKTNVASNLSVLTYTVNGLPLGETCFDVTANTSGGESTPVEGCKSVVAPRPGPVSGLVVQ